MAEYQLPKIGWARAVTAAFVLLIAAAIAALFVFAPKNDTPPAAEPAPAATQPVEQPAPEPAPTETAPSQIPEPSATPTVKPLPTLVEALREAYPGIEFFEGEWGEFVPTADDLVGQPGTYAAVPGITASYDAAKLIQFAGGTAVAKPGRIWAFSGDAATELLIEIR